MKSHKMKDHLSKAEFQILTANNSLKKANAGFEEQKIQRGGYENASLAGKPKNLDPPAFAAKENGKTPFGVQNQTRGLSFQTKSIQVYPRHCDENALCDPNS